MNVRTRQLLPHVFVMVSLYALLLIISGAIFGRNDIWALFTIAVAILFGYKPTVIALGIAPDPWVDGRNKQDGHE